MSKTSIIRCRVSTATQAQQGESMDTQEQICREISTLKNAEVVKVFKESISGRKEDNLKNVIEYIKKSKIKIDYLIVRNIDRLTRGGAGAYDKYKKELSKLGVELIDSMGIIQPQRNTLEHLKVEYDWSNYSPSSTAEIVMADYSNQEVRNILTRTISREIELVRSGYHIGHRPDGYQIKKTDFNGKKKSILKPDNERAIYYTKMFEMRASGQYDDKAIVNQINALGFKTVVRNKWDKTKTRIIGTRGGGILTVKLLQSIIQRPIYCGVIAHKMTAEHGVLRPIKAQFDGLVSIETFNKANRGKIFIKELRNNEIEILYDYHTTKRVLKRNKNNPLFPYKFIRCGICGKPMLASRPKGKAGKRFPTYHCQRNHEYYGISKNKFEENIRSYILSIKFRPQYLKLLEQVMINKYRKRQKELAEYSAQANQNVSDMKTEIAQAIDCIVVPFVKTRKSV